MKLPLAFFLVGMTFIIADLPGCNNVKENKISKNKLTRLLDNYTFSLLYTMHLTGMKNQSLIAIPEFP